MFWEILGIEPTTDKKKITMAYREKLVETNPEDKPEQFKALRDAYEQALAYADNDGKVELTPVELWKQKLEAVYNDFTKRKDLRYWQQLLSEDVCYGLDTRMKVEEELLHFFMNQYFISHEVWQYLDSQFSFMDRVDELYESYPKDFIDYVIVNGINYDDTLPLDMFYPGVNGPAAEAYLSDYLKARNAELEEAKEYFVKLKQSAENHPYGDAMMVMADINEEKDTVDSLAQIVEKYHYDHRLALMLANCYFNDNEFVKCEEVCRKGLENYEGDTRIMWCLANALAGQEKYKDGIEILHDLMKAAGGDQRQLADLNDRRAEWNESLIVKYSEQYKENPDDNSLKLDLAWALLQNDRFNEADEISSHILLEQCDPFDYYNLLSNIDFCMERIDAGLEKLDHLIEVIDHMEDDGTKKTKKRLGRKAEMISRKAYFLCASQRVEEGLETYKKAIEVDGSDADVLTQIAQMSYRFKNYEDTISYAKQLVQVKPNAYHGYLLMAYGLFMLDRDNEAYESVNRAIDLYGGDLESYVLKLRILIRNGAQEPARELLQFLEDNNCGDDLSVMYCKGNILEFFDKNNEDALEIYEKIVNAIENENEHCSIVDLVYYRYLNLIGEKKNANKPEDRKEMLEIAQKGLDFNENHYGLNDYKAWLLMRDGKLEESLEIYKKLLENERHSPEVEYQIAKIYYEDLDKNADLALEYFLKAYEKGHMGSLFYLAYTYYFMGNYDESEKYCLLLREDEQKRGNIDIDSYYRMSYIYEKRQQFDKALAENEQALENARKNGSKLENYYNHKIRLLRMMNRPIEAINTCDKLIEECQVDYGLKMKSEIYMQFGMYAEAKKIIDARLKSTNQDHGRAAADLVKLQFMSDHMAKAKFSLFNYKGIMDQWDVDQSNLLINEYELKFEKNLEINLQRLQDYREKNSDVSNVLVHIAETYDRLGDKENAEKYAKLALESWNKETAKYSTSKAIQWIELSRIYILLGRYEEAKELFAKARVDLCGNCKYCACKDADSFETEILIQQGQIDEALERCQKLAEKWPDEEYFKHTIEYLKSRKK